MVTTMVTTKSMATTKSMVSEPETVTATMVTKPKVTEVNMADAMVTVSMVTIHVHGCRRHHYSLRWCRRWSVPVRRRIVGRGPIGRLRRRWGYHLWCLGGRSLGEGWGRWRWVHGSRSRWVFLHLGFEG